MNVVGHIREKGSIPLRPMRVGMLVGTTSVSGGGVIEAVRSLSHALARQPGVSVEVFSLGQQGREGLSFGAIPVHLAKPLGPSSFGYAPGLAGLLHSRDLDILHVHGLWMYLSVAARRWGRETGRPYVVSPHGMLDPWALQNSGLKKRFARYFYEDAHLREASCLHALCVQEREAIRSAGYTTPVAIVPNGVDLPETTPESAPWRLALPRQAKVLLFLGRVTPKKKVLELIRAFAGAGAPEYPWHLVVVGPAAADYLAEIESMVHAHDCASRVHIVGPAYGEDRASAYHSADAFILPSISEGLPMAALEAFAFSLPALLTPHCNLPEAFKAGAALEIGADEQEIGAGLQRLFAMSNADRLAMGRRGRRLAEETFNWDGLAAGFTGIYRRLIGRAGLIPVDAAASDRA